MTSILSPSPGLENSRSQFWLLVGLAMALIGIGIYITTNYVMDDAMITLRYSYNFAQSGTAAWNPAEIDDPSLGFTTTLWMLINTVPATITENKDHLLLFAKWFSLLPILVIVLVFVRAIHRMEIPTVSKVVLVLAIFTQAGYGFHLNSAMETLFFSALILMAVVTYDQTRSGWLAYVFGTIAFLTRPEGAITVAAICFLDLRNGNIRRAVLGGFGFGVVVLILVLTLYQVYGQVLPNPFYVKQAGVGISGASIRHTLLFLVTLASPFVIMTAFSAFILKNKTSQIVMSLASIYVVYFLTVAPMMNVMSRYQWPVLVLLTLGSFPFLEMVSKKIKAHLVIGVVTVGLLIFTNVANGFGAHYFATTTGKSMRSLVNTGKVMNQYLDTDRWLVYHDAGAICYYSEWNCHETTGLTNREIARGEIGRGTLYGADNAQLVLRNVDLDDPASMERQRIFGQSIQQYGYELDSTVVILDEEGRRQFGVSFFVKEPQYYAEMLKEIESETSPNVSQQPFYWVYKTAKALVHRE